MSIFNNNPLLNYIISFVDQPRELRCMPVVCRAWRQVLLPALCHQIRDRSFIDYKQLLCHQDHVLSILQKCVHVRRADLLHCDSQTTNKILSIIHPEALTHLQLEWQDPSLLDTIQRFPHLTVLDISQSPLFDDAMLKKLVLSLPSIQHLGLAQCPKLTVEGVLASTSQLTSLSSFSIGGRGLRFSPQDLSQFLQAHPALKMFADRTDPMGIRQPGDYLQPIIEDGSHLESLTLFDLSNELRRWDEERCSRPPRGYPYKMIYPYKTMSSLAACCPHLTHLDFSSRTPQALPVFDLDACKELVSFKAERLDFVCWNDRACRRVRVDPMWEERISYIAKTHIIAVSIEKMQIIENYFA